MSVPLTLLGLLEREPSHGYELKRDYDAYFGRGKPLPFGQVYATLGRLARDGKVAAGEAEPGAGPDRKRYVITEAGATEFETWLAELEHEPELVATQRAALGLAHRVDPAAVEPDFPGVRGQNPGQAVQQRRLAGPAGPHHGQDLSGGHHHAGPPKGRRLAE